MATTEAGYVCWQSGWRCIDLWGLNDKRIAHDGYLDEGELAELDPDVIVRRSNLTDCIIYQCCERLPGRLGADDALLASRKAADMSWLPS